MTKEKIKMKPSIWRRVDIQVSLFTAIVVALLTFSIFWFQYRITYNDTLISLRDQAEAIYGYVEKRLVRTREDMEGDVYKQAHEAFQRIREISGVRYLYTAKMNEDGEFVYLIDCLDQSEPDFRYPGDLIEHEIYPDMQRALDGQKVLPDRIKDTEWGKIFITYMPIYDGEQVLGVVGIEFEAGHQYDTYRSLRLLLPLFILLFSLGACLASRLLFRRISNPFYRDMSNTDYLTQLKNRNAYQLDIGNRIAGKAQEGTCGRDGCFHNIYLTAKHFSPRILRVQCSQNRNGKAFLNLSADSCAGQAIAPRIEPRTRYKHIRRQSLCHGQYCFQCVFLVIRKIVVPADNSGHNLSLFPQNSLQTCARSHNAFPQDWFLVGKLLSANLTIKLIQIMYNSLHMVSPLPQTCCHMLIAHLTA